MGDAQCRDDDDDVRSLVLSLHRTDDLISTCLSPHCPSSFRETLAIHSVVTTTCEVVTSLMLQTPDNLGDPSLHLPPPPFLPPQPFTSAAKSYRILCYPLSLVSCALCLFSLSLLPLVQPCSCYHLVMPKDTFGWRALVAVN